MREVVPAVVRVVDVPSSATLPELHDIFQVALGWTDSHLHQFIAGGLRYGVPHVDDFDDERDEAGMRLADLPTRFGYVYDFGDNWEHDVELLGRGGDEPGCVYGEGTCPPEDCGGPGGYAELLDVLANPNDDEHEHMRSWVGDRLAGFDRAATDMLVRQTIGAVPESVRLVLDLAHGGMRLTPGGRLPRAFVRQVQQQRPDWRLLDRPAQLEDDLPPLAVLHNLLRSVGLLRLRHGVVYPTRAAGDDLEVVRRLRSWFSPDGEFTTMLAGVTVTLVAAFGPIAAGELAAKAADWLGPHWTHMDGRPMTVDDVRFSISRQSALLRGLDQVQVGWPAWREGPSARWLLPRATALTAIWSLRDRAQGLAGSVLVDDAAGDPSAGRYVDAALGCPSADLRRVRITPAAPAGAARRADSADAASGLDVGRERVVKLLRVLVVEVNPVKGAVTAWAISSRRATGRPSSLESRPTPFASCSLTAQDALVA